MIHPRRLKGTPGNIGRYFTVGDYYSKGPDEQSEWGGRIAIDLILKGRVEPDTFEELLAGRINGQQLGRHRGDGIIQHHPGWDFAVNTPKSVSIMALVGDDDRIFLAHEASVTAALDYLETHAALRRRGADGVEHRTTGRLLYARFTEHASRELDPHLHTHVVVMNMTSVSRGDPMASLETRAMYSEQMTAGQVYRNELARALRGLGYDIIDDPRTGLFEIRGVPQDLIDDMSTRAGQIDAHAREHGLTGQAARRISFYKTRKPKERTTFSDLSDRWRDRLGRHGEIIRVLRDQASERAEVLAPTDPATSARAMLFGLRQADGREAVNNRGQMIRLALAAHLGEVRLNDLAPVLDEHEARRKLLETARASGGKMLVSGRTLRSTVRRELAIADHLSLALNDAVPLASPEQLRQQALESGLSDAQSEALLTLGTSTHRLTGLHGVAGSGKSMLIRALKEATGNRTKLVALAPTSSAAANLGTSADLPARTVASLIAEGGRNLDESHVLILDEAGQLGNRQALRILEISRNTGARLILIGDNLQTGAIEQGKPFWLMQRLGLPKAELTESVRQETRSLKAAVTQARLGNYAASIAALDRVTEGAGAERLAEQLVCEWTRLKPASRAGTNILVLDNATRMIVNRAVREALKSEGAIAAQQARLAVLIPAGMSADEKRLARFYSAGQVVTFARNDSRAGLAQGTEYRVLGLSRRPDGRPLLRLADGRGRVLQWDPRLGPASRVNVFNSDHRELADGDRIQWRLVNHSLGIRNSDRGTIEHLEGTVATIRWDRDGRIQDIDLAHYKSWDHGYAETVYSAQSKTYARVYILAASASPLVTGQTYYTAVTRARLGAKLWTENVERLVDRLERNSGEKSSALEGRGSIGRSRASVRGLRHAKRLDGLRAEQIKSREERKTAAARADAQAQAVPTWLAGRAQQAVHLLDRWFARLVEGSQVQTHDKTPDLSHPGFPHGRPGAAPASESQHER